MGAISKVWMGLLLLLVSSCLAEEPEWAGLRIANGIGVGPHALKVRINGDLWSKQGLARGQVSSLRRLQAGRYRLSFLQDGLAGHEVRVVLEPGQQVTLVPHVQRKRGSPAWRIKVLRLNAAPAGTGRVATVVDVGLSERRVLEIKQIGKSWAPLSLRHLELQRFKITQHRGYLPLRVGQRTLHSMPVFEEGHHVMVLFDVPGVGVSCLFFRDRIQPAPSASG